MTRAFLSLQKHHPTKLVLEKNQPIFLRLKITCCWSSSSTNATLYGTVAVYGTCYLVTSRGVCAVPYCRKCCGVPVAGVWILCPNAFRQRFFNSSLFHRALFHCIVMYYAVLFCMLLHLLYCVRLSLQESDFSGEQKIRQRIHKNETIKTTCQKNIMQYAVDKCVHAY